MHKSNRALSIFFFSLFAACFECKTPAVTIATKNKQLNVFIAHLFALAAVIIYYLYLLHYCNSFAKMNWLKMCNVV